MTEVSTHPPAVTAHRAGAWRRWAALGLLVAGAAAVPVQAAGDGWRRITPTGTITGADGQPHSATCSGYPGTDPTYRFWVRRGDPSKLAVLFDGGGACWDDLTCSFPFGKRLPDAVPQFYNPSIRWGERPSQVGGILDTDNPANPARDWTLVVLPYCTGDVHLGSTDRTYHDAGHPIYDLPDTFTIHHRGYDNFMVVLDWIGQHLSAPSQLLVAGSSAGGYGASAHFPWLARQFPLAELTVLSDASQGVTTSAFDNGPDGRAHWNPQLPEWVAGSDPLQVPSADLLYRGALAYPQGRFAQYTSTQDSVQVGFYGYMKAYYGPGGSCPDPTVDWSQQMQSRLDGYTADLPNFRSFVVPGTAHTVLGSDSRFYADTSTGTPFASWLAEMLTPGGGPGWVDAACAECRIALTCP